MKKTVLSPLIGLLALLVNEPSISNNISAYANTNIFPHDKSRYLVMEKEEASRHLRKGIEDKLWFCDPIPRIIEYTPKNRFYPLTGSNYLIPHPVKNWGRKELLSTLREAACEMYEHYGVPLKVYDLSQRSGRKIPHHGSHRTGRDADVGHYIINSKGQYDNVFRSLNSKELKSSLEPNWVFIKAVQENPAAEVTYIFWDRRYIEVMKKYIQVKYGEEEWKKYGSVLNHWKGHKDHFHIRIKEIRPPT